VDAICLVPSSLLVAHADLLIHKALEDQIPLAVHEDSLVKQGALIAYGASFQSLGRQAAKLVHRILQGTQPSALPIQTPDHMTLAINLTTARAIGLTVSRSLLERAEIIIE
jgi:putative ABC transport system substrate-binding protein